MEKIIADAIQIRRCLHRRPEEGWTEFETSFLVAERLKKLGLEVLVGLEVIDPEYVMGRSEQLVGEAIKRARTAGVPQSFIDATSGYTGVVGIFDTGREGPVTAMRFDMDCVLVEESRSKEHVPTAEGFESEFPGLMHACGHDGHTALGLALAAWVSTNKDALKGKIKFIFQPAEEGTRGGAPMAARGVVDDVDWFFAGHVGMLCQSGQIGICRAGFLATTKIDIRFEGRPSHAGANPEKGRSALSAACAADMMIQGISRHCGGDSRIAIGRLVAGEGRNVTPVHALMQLETRGQTEEVNAFLVNNVKNMVKGAAEAYEVQYKITKVGEATTLTTTPKGVELLKKCAEEIVGEQNVRVIDRVGGSEDATILMKRAVDHGAQAAFFMWGCDQDGHHKGTFDIQDTKNLPIAIAFGVKVLTKTNSL